MDSVTGIQEQMIVEVDGHGYQIGQEAVKNTVTFLALVIIMMDGKMDHILMVNLTNV